MAIDIICLIFLAYGFWIGYSKGIIATVLTLASYVFGILAAMKFGPIMGDVLYEWFPVITTGGSFLLGFILVFFLTLVLFKIVSRGLTGFLETVNINFINQILGGILSGLFFTFIFSGLVYFGDRSRIISDEVRTTSITYQPLSQIRMAVWEQGKSLYPVFRDFYDKAVDAMDRLSESVDKDENDSIFDLEE
ncbi:CvpA family protein [Neolewinella agarilytica]|jgi:membrane protein required for colicin V production|uniref:Membrane protein required for colicin V production n=1 Tax=Neolewinella agarilytica TaxID=478744 RepID=A0A1H9L8B4_9BACT|nr:CvpA family protein [Neolewinella agarilytica]SER07712.1 membrane protein required for colicin V production [Neolewinella agarilytica]